MSKNEIKAALKKPIGKMSKDEFVGIDRSKKLRDAVKFEDRTNATKGKSKLEITPILLTHNRL